MYSRIINPETNRRVNINGKLGRKILQKYISTIQTGGFSDIVQKQVDLSRAHKSKHKIISREFSNLIKEGMEIGWGEVWTHKKIIQELKRWRGSSVEKTGGYAKDPRGYKNEDAIGSYSHGQGLLELNNALDKLDIPLPRKWFILENAQFSVIRVRVRRSARMNELLIDLGNVNIIRMNELSDLISQPDAKFRASTVAEQKSPLV